MRRDKNEISCPKHRWNLQIDDTNATTRNKFMEPLTVYLKILRKTKHK